MRVFLVFVSMSFLSTGILNARDSPITPQEVLDRAVENFLPNCNSKTQRDVLDADHKTIEKPPVDKEDKESVQKLSLPVLFREKRFVLKFVEQESDDRTIVIAFSPVEEQLKLNKQKGENGNYNKAMNGLSGKVKIDQATMGIIGIDASAKEPIDYTVTFAKIRVFRVNELRFILDQGFKDGKWIPFHIIMEFEGRLLGVKDFHNRYNMFEFLCGSYFEPQPR